MTNEEWLKDQCNRYTNGVCQCHACLRRGGWKSGMPVGYEMASCHAHEILKEMEQMRQMVEGKCPPPRD